MKRIWCLLLSLCLCAGMVAPAMAMAMAVGTETRGNFWELVSLTRNTSVNERDNPFDSGKTVTIEWEDGSTEVEYSVVTQNTFWTLTSTGVDSGYNLAQYSISWYHQNSVGNYEFEDGGLQGESELPMTVSFNSPVFRGENTDTGSGEYLYRLYFDVYNFSLEDDVPVEYSFYFMWNEAEAQRMKAEFGGGQASTSPNPVPDNAEPEPDNIAPEANSPEPEASGKQFADVSNTAYYYNAVYWALRQNITEGTTDTAFSPNDACVRAQILTFIWRYAGKQEPSVSNPFHDVSADNYYYKAALWAYEKGMVSGTAFNGDTPCDRAAAVTYLWILAGRPDSPAGDTMFADIGSMEHPEAVAYATRTGITKGTTETTFSPDRVCTRAHIVTFLNRYERQFQGA